MRLNKQPRSLPALRPTAKPAGHLGACVCGCEVHLQVWGPFFGIQVQETHPHSCRLEAGARTAPSQPLISNVTATGDLAGEWAERWGEQRRGLHAASGCLFPWYMTQRHPTDPILQLQTSVAAFCSQTSSATDAVPSDTVPETLSSLLRTVSTESIKR